MACSFSAGWMYKRELKTAAPFPHVAVLNARSPEPPLAISFFEKRRGMTDSTLRYTNIKKENFLYKLGIAKRPQQMACDYRGDGLGVKGKSVSFMAEKKFSDAWENLTKEIEIGRASGWERVGAGV